MNYIFIAFEELEEGLGTGHISRVKRIIKSLSNGQMGQENIVTFITNHKLHNSGYLHVPVKSINETKNKVIDIINKTSINVVVFDCLDYCQEIYKLCKKNHIFSIGIDTSDVNKNTKDLDLLVNPVIHNDLSHHYGPLYSMHFEDTKGHVAKNMTEIKKIFICFGGIDYKQHLIKILPFLKLLPSSIEINIVLSNNVNKKNICTEKNMNLYYQPDNFYELLKGSDIAIISGGVIFQEAAYLGVPTFVVPQYKHQYDIANKRYQSKSCLGFSELDPDYEDIVLRINNFLDNPLKCSISSLNARALDDGFGLKRFESFLRIYDFLEWDSQFFKKKIFNLNTKSYSLSVHKKVELLIEKEKVDLIYFLCPSEDKCSINLAKKNNFQPVDNRLTYIISRESFKPRLINNNAVIKLSSKKNIERLQSIARNTQWASRYYKDSKFSKEDLKIFYGQWVKKSVTGDLDDMVFHIELDKKICGFISIKKEGVNFGSIGLVSVDQNYQGLGFGLALISYAVQYMFTKMDCASVSVVTQKENTNACIAYDKIGFRVNDSSTWLHKWV